MPVSDDIWRPGRIAAFLAIGALLYAGLFVWSDTILRSRAVHGPFQRITTAPDKLDWVILGASHAMPLAFGDSPALIAGQSGRTSLVLALPGGGPFTWRLIAERYFEDHTATGVLIVLDDFAFADDRWNTGRLGDSDVLPKIPADRATLGVLLRATERDLPLPVFAGYATGFARITDTTRLQPDRWQAEDKFETAPRPSDAADAARIAYLYSGPVDVGVMNRAFSDLEAVIGLALAHDAQVVVVRPPLPERFVMRLPEIAGFAQRLQNLLADHAVPLHDFSGTIPEPQFYFDTDHLNRRGVQRWLDMGLADVLRGVDNKGQ